jgi:hypothetical protein
MVRTLFTDDDHAAVAVIRHGAVDLRADAFAAEAAEDAAPFFCVGHEDVLA